MHSDIRRSALIVLTALPLEIAAQQSAGGPPRPDLGSGADTNSANAYYRHGMESIEQDPRRAAEAFHWAAVLDPNSGDALYARRVALLLSRPTLLYGYFEGARGVLESPQAAEVDSLLLRALELDPFFYRGLDKQLVTGYVTEVLRRRGVAVRRGSNELQVEIENYLRADAPPYLRALVAYAYRQFPRALDLLATTQRRTKSRAGLHAERAEIFHHLGRYDSAAAETRAALEELRRRDEAELVEVYESKALLEFSLGVILEAQGDLDGAHQAYGRSATENLGFHPAHIRLASLAFQRGDTATAVAEVRLAIDARPDDTALLVAGAVMLLRAARATEAVPHLERAVESNPHWATPRYLLARLYDSGGMRDDALAHYQGFLARATRDDARSRYASERLAALRPTAADTSGVSIRH